jgi:hypothetical protein
LPPEAEASPRTAASIWVRVGGSLFVEGDAGGGQLQCRRPWFHSRIDEDGVKAGILGDGSQLLVREEGRQRHQRQTGKRGGKLRDDIFAVVAAEETETAAERLLNKAMMGDGVAKLGPGQAFRVVAHDDGLGPVAGLFVNPVKEKLHVPFLWSRQVS